MAQASSRPLLLVLNPQTRYSICFNMIFLLLEIMNYTPTIQLGGYMIIKRDCTCTLPFAKSRMTGG